MCFDPLMMIAGAAAVVVVVVTVTASDRSRVEEVAFQVSGI